MRVPSASRNALVFGSSGISGWGIASALLRTPRERDDSFRRVIAVNNRLMTLEESYFSPDGRLILGSNIDLQLSVEEIKKRLLEVSDEVKDVTHMYFAGI
jgi:hypothetical protein